MRALFDDPLIKSRSRIACEYPEGYTVFHEGDRCEMVGLLITGELRLVHHSLEGVEVKLGSVRTGDLFGDYLINTKNPTYPGDLVALVDSTVVYIDKENIDWLIANHDRFRQFYMQKISEKALALNTHNKILNQPSLRERILLWLEIETTKRKDGVVPIRSKTALANYLNARRPSLSRAFKSLKNEGLIDVDRKTIRFK